MKEASENISIEHAKSALLRSGYLLEGRLEMMLRKSYWVESNVAYPDPPTGKSRELDLAAFHASQTDAVLPFSVSVRLLIECVNNPQPIAFMTKHPVGGPPYEDLYVKISGLPMKIQGNDSLDQLSLPAFLDMHSYHHYFRCPVASQYCSFQKKKGNGEWMAWHNEDHFDSFRKLCDVVEYFVARDYERWTCNLYKDIAVTLYYPVLVVQGDLIDVRTSKKSLSLKKAKHLQYRLSRIADGKLTDYQIDVVTERYFPQFLNMIAREQTQTARRMNDKKAGIRKSADEILEKLKGIGEPGVGRYIMETQE
jgi:hypothetical protein